MASAQALLHLFFFWLAWMVTQVTCAQSATKDGDEVTVDMLNAACDAFLMYFERRNWKEAPVPFVKLAESEDPSTPA